MSGSTLALFGFEPGPPPIDPVTRQRALIDASQFPIAADSELDARALDGITRDQLPALLDRICEDRMAAIVTAGTHLHEDTDRVWQLDLVLDAALRAIDAPEPSPLRGIITDRRARGSSGSRADGRGIFAMLFGLLTGVRGIAAGFAAIGAVVSGVYASVLRYEDYAFLDAVDKTAFVRDRHE